MDDKQELLEKLNSIVDFLGEMGANDMGWITERQANRFHRATDILQALAGELASEDEDKERARLYAKYGDERLRG